MENYRYRVFYESDGKREFMINPGQFSTFKKPQEWASFEKAVNAATSAPKQIKSHLYIMRINTGNTETKFFSPQTKKEVQVVMEGKNLPNSPEIKYPEALGFEKKSAMEKINPIPPLETAVKKQEDRIDMETIKVQLAEDVKEALMGKHASGKTDTVADSLNALKTAKHAKTEKNAEKKEAAEAEGKTEVNNAPSVTEMMDTMSRMLGYMRNSDDMHDELTKKVETEDLAICDILHYVELADSPMTPEEAYAVVGAIRSHRKVRREAKDQLMMIDGLRQDTALTTGKKISTYNMQTAIGILAAPRHYMPRVIKDMAAEIAKYALPEDKVPTMEAVRQETAETDAAQTEKPKKTRKHAEHLRMTPEEVKKITDMYNSGTGPYTIAKKIGRPGSSVQNVIRRGKADGTITRA